MPADRRIPVGRSLHGELRARRPTPATVELSKGALVAVSHLVEELVAASSGPALLVSGFQHGRNWAVERDRYLQLSDHREVIAVFAGREPPAAWETDHVGVRLGAHDPLAQEWFVLAVAPGWQVVLCGLDAMPGAQRPPQEADRRFSVLWSIDPELTEEAIAVVTEAVGEVAPERVADLERSLARVRAHPADPRVAARATDRLVARLLERLETAHHREREADRAASAAKTEFLSRMSHELRTPLHAVLGFAELLELGALDAEQADAVRRIGRAGEHLLGLVDDVLDVARIEDGRTRVQLADVPVDELVDDAASLVARAAGERSVIVADGAARGTGLAVRTDPRLAVQVLGNLLDNAVKHGPDGQTVTISAVAADEDRVLVAVRDQGPGIPVADRATIFLPFERGAAEARQVDGSGLGLAVAASIAEAVGATLRLASGPAEEDGAVFTVALPRAR